MAVLSFRVLAEGSTRKLRHATLPVIYRFMQPSGCGSDCGSVSLQSPNVNSGVSYSMCRRNEFLAAAGLC